MGAAGAGRSSSLPVGPGATHRVLPSTHILGGSQATQPGPPIQPVHPLPRRSQCPAFSPQKTGGFSSSQLPPSCLPHSSGNPSCQTGRASCSHLGGGPGQARHGGPRAGTALHGPGQGSARSRDKVLFTRMVMADWGTEEGALPWVTWGLSSAHHLSPEIVNLPPAGVGPQPSQVQGTASPG